MFVVAQFIALLFFSESQNVQKPFCVFRVLRAICNSENNLVGRSERIDL